MNIRWDMPDRRGRADGEVRRVGIEIELQGIAVDQLAERVATTLGGSAERVSSAEFVVEVPEHGEYRVEIDYRLLKELARDQESQADADGRLLADLAVETLGSTSSLLIPCEIVTPPIAIDEIAAPVDALVADLREAGAEGTKKSFLYAFGVHLNVEPPDLEADTITRYLRAFVCLYDWLVEEAEIDLSRRIVPYIAPFRQKYELLVADPEYRPDWPRLIDDYLEHNPTRDRAMDMLPMFTHQDEKRVRAVVDDPLIAARPAFHYRLENCCIDEPGWTVADIWNRWMQIERLAYSPKKLAELARRFVGHKSRLFRGIDDSWPAQVRNRLAKRSADNEAP